MSSSATPILYDTLTHYLLSQLFGLFFFQKQGVWFVFIITIFIEILVFNANSIDSDQMPHSDLDLHCLSISLLGLY